MLKITLSNVAPFDGIYDLDFSESFTMRELHWIKEIAGVRVGELEDASDGGDSDLLIAFATIAIVRAGKLQKQQVSQFTELLLDTRDCLEFEDVPDEDDARPPEPGTQQLSPNTLGESEQSSSEGSNGTGDDLLVTGLGSIGQQP